MDWIQFAIFVGSTVGLFFWNRSESNADRREAAADRRDMLQLIRNIEIEIKDFHGRLCAIEEKNRDKK